MQRSFVALFSGCGGFDLGFLRRGFECLAAFDSDPLAVSVHRRNLNAPVHMKDLSAGLSASEALSPDVVLAGPPCQGFSLAGRRRHDDPRNRLLMSAANLAIRMAPRIIIIENVLGVRTGTHAAYWDAVHERIRHAGYNTTSIVCRGEQCGVPQMRKRLVLFAWRKGPSSLPGLREVHGGVLGDVLSRLDGLPNHEPILLDRESESFDIARHIGPGQKLGNVRASENYVSTWRIPSVFGSVDDDEIRVLEAIRNMRRAKEFRLRENGDADPVAADAIALRLPQLDVLRILDDLVAKDYIKRVDGRYDLRNSFNGTYWRPRLDRPSPTVDTRFGNPRHFLHPQSLRAFTAREAARIQGFPDDFVFEGSLTDQFRLIGNAVPPPMGERLAELALKVLE